MNALETGRGEEGKRRASCIHKRLLTFSFQTHARQKEQCLDPCNKCCVWEPVLASFLLLSWNALKKGNLKEKWLVSAPNSRLQSMAAGKPQPWELETSGHTTSIVKNEEKSMCACSVACAQLNFSTHETLGPLPREWRHPCWPGLSHIHYLNYDSTPQSQPQVTPV